MQFRAIATDLDGTLLRTDKSVSARTRDAVDAAEDAGLLFVIATGRPPRWIPPVIEQLGERGLVVCANGGSVYDPARHEIVARTDIPADVALSIIDEVEAAYPDAVLGVEQGFEFAADTSIERTDFALLESWKLGGMRIGPIRDFVTEGVTKLIVRLPNDTPAGTAAAVQELLGGRALVTHSTTESFLELSHPDVHKASTVERLLLDSGIEPHEVVAFGDMPNDLALVQWAGLGVAVANAHPILRDAADEVTASNDDDGVALVIERILTEI
ncbi:HAD family hydrolase [Aquihabitans daechungensis]|uniref:HAD family hydrolase n=1 Tax=Aquihabitans daechungensis TaxID=1052257 RepID=UPI003B9E0C42